ncbi:hypothetical protein BJ875DRAFT_442732 [Amylocarpus encephaloides]|uniref:Uncharacterized protein n=1 Tax=Amylocarpus encephaloides TaxID=45428 RepID=A0A9P7YFW3_9HELO|nr:hypothetical protein BJ875DRAFT_442732 [Amylocarpus encephaloides]
MDPTLKKLVFDSDGDLTLILQIILCPTPSLPSTPSYGIVVSGKPGTMGTMTMDSSIMTASASLLINFTPRISNHRPVIFGDLSPLSDHVLRSLTYSTYSCALRKLPPHTDNNLLINSSRQNPMPKSRITTSQRVNVISSDAFSSPAYSTPSYGSKELPPQTGNRRSGLGCSHSPTSSLEFMKSALQTSGSDFGDPFDGYSSIPQFATPRLKDIQFSDICTAPISDTRSDSNSFLHGILKPITTSVMSFSSEFSPTTHSAATFPDTSLPNAFESPNMVLVFPDITADKA